MTVKLFCGESFLGIRAFMDERAFPAIELSGKWSSSGKKAFLVLDFWT